MATAQPQSGYSNNSSAYLNVFTLPEPVERYSSVSGNYEATTLENVDSRIKYCGVIFQ